MTWSNAMNLNNRATWALGTMVLGASVAAAVEYDLSWHTMDGGGAMRTTGGNFEISGTIGQPDAGRLSGGGFEISGGFWFEVPPGDCTQDGGVEIHDFVNFGACLAGPGGDPGSARCDCLDLDGDGDVDLADMAEFQASFIGN